MGNLVIVILVALGACAAIALFWPLLIFIVFVGIIWYGVRFTRTAVYVREDAHEYLQMAAKFNNSPLPETKHHQDTKGESKWIYIDD